MGADSFRFARIPSISCFQRGFAGVPTEGKMHEFGKDESSRGCPEMARRFSLYHAEPMHYHSGLPTRVTISLVLNCDYFVGGGPMIQADPTRAIPTLDAFGLTVTHAHPVHRRPWKSFPSAPQRHAAQSHTAFRTTLQRS